MNRIHRLDTRRSDLFPSALWLLVWAILCCAIDNPPACAMDAEFEEQVAALGSPEQLSREMALARLGQRGGRSREAIGDIAPLLKDPAEGVRVAAAQALGRIGNPSDVSGPALLAALDDPSLSVRAAAINALRHLNWDRPTVTAKLVDMAAHESWVQRVAVADGLMMARELKEQPEIEQAAVTALLKLLADPYVLARSAAARSLAGTKVGSDSTIPALIRAAADPDWRVRRDVAGALGSFGEQAASANEALVALLRDEDREARLRAGQSLRAVNPSGAFDLMLAATKDGNENIRATAVEAIGRYGGSEQVVAALASALGDGSAEVRFRAVRAIDALGPNAKAALEPLARCVNDRNCIVREYACRALGRMGPEAATAVPVLLVAASGDWHGGVRKSAAAALIAIQPVPAPATTQ